MVACGPKRVLAALLFRASRSCSPGVAVALLPVYVCMSAPPCSLGGWVGAPHAPADEGEMATNPSSSLDGRRFVRLLGYLLAEFPPATRQTLDLLYSPQGDAGSSSNNDINIISSSGSCSAAVAIDAQTTARLRGECASRGVPLESALLASLCLAAARGAVGEGDRVPRAASSDGNGHHHGDVSRRANDVVRLQRALVLGVVSVVMALLSGSVDSKALRYFCSFYAVFSGAWAVNVLTVESPGFMFLMATSADMKGGGGTRASSGGRCGPTYTPVRLAVDSRRGLWGTAERHKRGALGMALSEKSFSRFKRRARGARRAWLWCSRRWERRRASASLASAKQETVVQQGPPPHFQLLGCIETDGRVDDADLAALLAALDSRYTLVYRAARGSLMSSSDGGGSDSGVGGRGAFEQTATTTTAVAPAATTQEGLQLAFVERTSARSSRLAKDGNGACMAKWLLQEATAILVGEVSPPPA